MNNLGVALGAGTDIYLQQLREAENRRRWEAENTRAINADTRAQASETRAQSLYDRQRQEDEASKRVLAAYNQKLSDWQSGDPERMRSAALNFMKRYNSQVPGLNDDLVFGTNVTRDKDGFLNIPRYRAGDFKQNGLMPGDAPQPVDTMRVHINDVGNHLQNSMLAELAAVNPRYVQQMLQQQQHQDDIGVKREGLGIQRDNAATDRKYKLEVMPNIHAADNATRLQAARIATGPAYARLDLERNVGTPLTMQDDQGNTHLVQMTLGKNGLMASRVPLPAGLHFVNPKGPGAGAGAASLASMNPESFVKLHELATERASRDPNFRKLPGAAQNEAIDREMQLLAGGGLRVKGAPNVGKDQKPNDVAAAMQALIDARNAEAAKAKGLAPAEDSRPWYAYDYPTDLTNEDGVPNVGANGLNAIRNWFAAQGRKAQGY